MRLLVFLLSAYLLIFYSCQPKSGSKEVEGEVEAKNLYYEKASKLLAENKLDSSFIYFDWAHDRFLQQGDSLNAATCLIQMAITLYLEGDYYGSQETSIEADKLIDKSEKANFPLLSFNYNNLGNVISAYGDHKAAITYYDLALQYAANPTDYNTYLNNKAITLTYMQEYKEANAIYSSILKTKFSSDTEYARMLSNYAHTRSKIFPHYNALPDLHKALKYRINGNDQYGINASYAHLRDYHKTTNRDSALVYAQKAYAIASQLKSAKDKINAAESLIQLSKADSSRHYFSIYKHLNDSVLMARQRASNQYAMIRYEVEKSKKENLQLQKEVLNKDLSITRQRILGGSLLIFVLGITGFLIYRNNRRKAQIKLAAEKRIRDHQLKTSRKVHDVVANGIYRVMSEIEYSEHLDKDNILDSLELMYEKSRDISYESEGELNTEDFKATLGDLLKSFSTLTTRIIIVGNSTALWEKVKENIQKEVLLICQEMMVNMSKHSKATEVSIQFDISDSSLNLKYSDNGIGFNNQSIFGNGLKNTETRIEKLNGAIIFDSEEGNGLRVFVSIPLK